MVEVAFHSRPLTDRSAPPPAPTIIVTPPTPSSKTLQTALLDAFNLRDKKGKGKAVDPEEATWRLAQREWVESFKAGGPELKDSIDEDKPEEEETSQEVATEKQKGDEIKPEDETVTTAEGENVEEPRLDDEEETTPIATEEAQPAPVNESEPKDTSSPVRPPAHSAAPIDDDSPFVLLLAFHSRPVYPDSTPTDGTQPAPAPAPTSTKPPSRSVYQLQLTASLTLREALAGSTLLENPCFEIWPRETFLRQKLLGKLKIVEQPAELRVRERTGTWERGRGRGRGTGGGRGGFNSSDRGNHRGGGGGSRGRGRGGSFEGRRDDHNRSQDSGWGKRPSAEDYQGGDVKRARND